MDKDILRQVQLVQLEILKEVRRVCDDNEIQFFLDSGTLLGAVRHKGVIPWDDDLDIGMIYKEYERFISLADKELSPQYYLETWDNDPGYPFPFAKIMKRNTKYVEDAFENTGKRNEIYIDVFPYFPCSADTLRHKKEKWLIEHYRRLEYMISEMKPWVRQKRFIKRLLVRIKYLPAYFATRFMRKEKINNQYYSLLCNLANTGFDYYIPGGISKLGRWAIPKECFSEYVLLEFEDDKFPCPGDYDSYLRNAYGDYMTLPPVDQRENRHHIVEVKL